MGTITPPACQNRLKGLDERSGRGQVAHPPTRCALALTYSPLMISQFMTPGLMSGQFHYITHPEQSDLGIFATVFLRVSGGREESFDTLVASMMTKQQFTSCSIHVFPCVHACTSFSVCCSQAKHT